MSSQDTGEMWDLRFGGVVRLYGRASKDRFRSARVLIIGIGGVGTWVAEALARSGIGHLGLMDMDDVCVTNTNRQLHAVADAIGRSKTSAMADRLRAIHPEIVLTEWTEFFSSSNQDQVRRDDWDMVVDAIDAVPAKCQLLAHCRSRGLPVVTCGGAGGKRDGTQVRVADLARTIQDPLLRQVRKRLRKEHGFPAGETESFGIPAVYSAEPPVFPWADGTVCPSPEEGSSLRLDCSSGFGTAAHVTGAFGLAAAGVVLRELLATEERRRGNLI
jgi:tRNA threonylcarbamoyladenosine dehydratase